MLRPTRHDLPEPARRAVVDLLAPRLADLIDLKSQLQQAHWTVRGPTFIALHELFGELADGLGEPIDDVAERIAQLGGTPRGTVRAAAGASSLADYPSPDRPEEHVRAVASALAATARSVRSAIDEASRAGDQGTADLLTGISRQVDKALWVVEAHER